ncbi:MAG TPA: hypothetical protein VGC87_09660 [Pyrinomonadaceae bacterium]|jgi:hypothetical protein
MELAVGFIIGLVVAAIGAWCTVYFQRYSLKQQNTLNLSERYNSPDFHVVRAIAWELRDAWGRGDRTIVKYFVFSVAPENAQCQYQRCSNGLWPHQNLSTLLHFYGNLARYYDAGLVNKKLLKVLFEPQYFWYESFIHEFVKEYEVEMQEQQLPAPQWITALSRLEIIFDKHKKT